MPIPTDVKNDFQAFSTYLSPMSMALAVHAINEHRITKSKRPLNCFVLSNTGEPGGNELEEFLVKLNETSERIPDHTRFQILYNDNIKQSYLNHWSAVDVLVRNNQLEFLILDAGGTFPSVIRLITHIAAYCPQAKITYAGGCIQYDDKHCAYFSLDHVIAMAGIETLHDDLAQCVTTPEIETHNKIFKNYSAFVLAWIKFSDDFLPLGQKLEDVSARIEALNYIQTEDIPAHMGSLLKNIQSLSRYNETYQGKEYTRNNKSSLDKYIEEHTKEPNFFSSKPSNNAIIDKKEKIKEIAKQILENISDEGYQKIQDSRTNFERLIKNDLPDKVENNPIISSTMIFGIFSAASGLTGLGLLAAGIAVACITLSTWPIGLMVAGCMGLGAAGFFAVKAVNEKNHDESAVPSYG